MEDFVVLDAQGWGLTDAGKRLWEAWIEESCVLTEQQWHQLKGDVADDIEEEEGAE